MPAASWNRVPQAAMEPLVHLARRLNVMRECGRLQREVGVRAEGAAALEVEAGRLGTLLDALSQENLDNQRAVVKNEKRWSYDNRPYGSWSEKIQAHLFPPEHPYHHTTIGSMEDLDAASLEDVSKFFRTYYAPNNATLAIVGDFEPARVKALVEKYFGTLKRGPAVPKLDVPAPSADPGQLRMLQEAIGPRHVIAAASTHPGSRCASVSMSMPCAPRRPIAAALPCRSAVSAP